MTSSKTDQLRVRAWRESGQHLPPFLRDFHDQKDLFRALHTLTRPPEGEEELVSWQTGQIYAIDTFLWAMARFGYTLQKSRVNLPFEDLETAVRSVTEAREAQATAVLKQALDSPHMP